MYSSVIYFQMSELIKFVRNRTSLDELNTTRSQSLEALAYLEICKLAEDFQTQVRMTKRPFRWDENNIAFIGFRHYFAKALGLFYQHYDVTKESRWSQVCDDERGKTYFKRRTHHLVGNISGLFTVKYGDELFYQHLDNTDYSNGLGDFILGPVEQIFVDPHAPAERLNSVEEALLNAKDVSDEDRKLYKLVFEKNTWMNQLEGVAFVKGYLARRHLFSDVKYQPIINLNEQVLDRASRLCQRLIPQVTPDP